MPNRPLLVVDKEKNQRIKQLSENASADSDSMKNVRNFLNDFYNDQLYHNHKDIYDRFDGSFPSKTSITRFFNTDTSGSKTTATAMNKALLALVDVVCEYYKDVPAIEKPLKPINEKRRTPSGIEIWNHINRLSINSKFIESVFHQIDIADKELFNRDGSRFVSREDCDLIANLVTSLQKNYQTDARFTSIGLLADKEGIFGRLPMDEDFVQLSYIGHAEARTRDSMNRSEAELNLTKINRSVISNQKLSRDYVVNYHFNNIRQLLVLGSPGIGKSTFSRWHCYEWVKDPRHINTIPVFIELRRLDFNHHGHMIVAYIRQVYGLTVATAERWLDLLRKASQAICFILDGYDELSEENKQKLGASLSAISAGARYILTSRPYGVLDTYELSFTETIQIDGLDVANINRYIDTFIRKSHHPEIQTKERLLQIINGNNTLADFAHNPLLLSFMVVIYLSDQDAENTLRNIQSRFGLQETVASWMLQHHATVMPGTLKARTADLACSMELGKEFEKTGRRFDSDHEMDQLLAPLSRIGIGQLVTERNNRYKFYFNSVSFQEYFAALALREKITVPAFGYLLQDSYFWNLCAMLAGGTKDEALLSGLLRLCEQEIKASEDEAYDHYRYILLLSECTRDFLDKVMDKDRLTLIYQSYQVTRQKNDPLVFAAGECIQRIYKKIGLPHQATFKKIIVDVLKTVLAGKGNKYKDREMEYTHIPALVEHIGLRNDTGFCTDVSDLLIKSLGNLKKAGKSDQNLSEVLIDILITLHPEGPATDPDYVRHLKKADCLLPPNDLAGRANIQLHYADTATARLALKTLPEKYTRARKKQDKELLAGELLLSLFIIARRNAKAGTILVSEQDQNEFNTAADLLFSYLEMRGKQPAEQVTATNVYDFADLVYIAATGFFETNDLQRIDQGLQLIRLGKDMDDMELYPVNKETVSRYFDRLVDNSARLPDDEQLKNLAFLVQHVPLLKNKIALQRHKIVAVIDRYLSRHRKILQHYRSPYAKTPAASQISAATERKLEQVVTGIEPFFNLLAGDDYKIYETDKHYFIRTLIEKSIHELAYFRRYVLRRVFSDRISIYSALYGDVILACLNDPDPDVAKDALYVCTNPSIYNYSSNLPFLGDVLDALFLQSADKTFVQAYAHDIMFVVAHTLLLIRRNNLRDNIATSVINRTGRILKNSLLRKITLKSGIENWVGGQQAAYMMQYYFTREEAFDLGVDYAVIMAYNSFGTDKLLDCLFNAFIRNDRLPQQDIAVIAETAGERMAGMLSDMANYLHFSKEAFESLCSAP